MKPANSTLSGYGTTIFEVMSRLAIEHRSINLGQGFPDEDGPAALKAGAARVMDEALNQYPPMMGVPELRRAVAAHNARFYGLNVDWREEVLVTSGATEALAACMLGLIEPGDEVVAFEPLYDSYLPMICRAGGVPRLVRLEPPDWRIDPDALEAAFSGRTKFVLLNTPQNPASKVYDADELSLIARMMERYDTYAVCDEVYEHIVFDGRRHVPLMTLPGMRERCVRIGSAGKTFSMTGWKVGYLTAPPDLLGAIAKAHQFLVFTTPPMLQHAVAEGLAADDAYFAGLAGAMQAKRERLAAGLARAGLAVLDAEGTYFLTADIRPLGFDGTDEDFCRHVTVKAGVTALPSSAFYVAGMTDSRPRHFVRFCFSKKDAVLDEACGRLARHFAGG